MLRARRVVTESLLDAAEHPEREEFEDGEHHGDVVQPEAHGGAGLDYSYSVAMAETLGHIHCGGVPMAIGVQTDMATPALARFGSEELKAQFLAPAIAGEAVACIGVSEPGAGSDVSAIRTHARKDGDDYVISGQKMWITNGSQADVAVVWAKLVRHGDTAVGDDKTIRGFLVPTNTPGFRARDQKGKLSLRASDTSELILEGVRLPARDLEREAFRGLPLRPEDFADRASLLRALRGQRVSAGGATGRPTGRWWKPSAAMRRGSYRLRASSRASVSSSSSRNRAATSASTDCAGEPGRSCS